MALSVNELFPETDEKPNIIKLAFVVFICTLLAATQDIAVDGWALTLLQKFVLLFSFTFTINQRFPNCSASRCTIEAPSSTAHI